MEKGRSAENDLEYKPLPRGWFFGHHSLKERLLERLGRQDRKLGYRGEPWNESAEQTAQRRVQELLEKHRWTEEDLRTRRKGDPIKVNRRRIAENDHRDTGVDRVAALYGNRNRPRICSIGRHERQEAGKYYDTMQRPLVGICCPSVRPSRFLLSVFCTSAVKEDSSLISEPT
jgi:hypothetical protein